MQKNKHNIPLIKIGAKKRKLKTDRICIYSYIKRKKNIYI